MFEHDAYPGGIIKPANVSKGGFVGAKCIGGVGVPGMGLDIAYAFIVAWLRRRNYQGDTLLLNAVYVQGGSSFVELDVHYARQYWSLVDRGNGHGTE